MRFIGDVHGKMDEYLGVIANCDESIQVGDFGAGFVPLPVVSERHRFIRGNHDSPSVCRESPNWIEDGAHMGDMFFCGGAFSIDRYRRHVGIDWWMMKNLVMRP